ncbi:hypothetical protein BIV57_20665 [Mangrovactinospora gilvigrisea]|uniref:Arsenic-transporting ATPase n=1 Tax=Mangrovactinospora gilvigrisea TaxID=1428644 RepID=A0A1J7C221_9ACTN|nr:ArsA-related P-loop ATPase [Mangrovactinospora gilvigrisea]OIV35616.1 hypothetical protein BIV57_20665 [Mangrovactinospora gilvigrisea]
MRTVLVTGKGGSGRTTAAAATAVLAARSGLRTLLLTTDAHRPPADLLGVAVRDAEPVEVEENLLAARTDAQAAFREETLAVQERVAPALDLLGVEPLLPEELMPVPGAPELVLLRTLRDEARSGAWDVLVVDAPDTPRLLAALTLPALLRRYLDRLLPGERRAARALRPVLADVMGVPMPAEWLFSAREWLDEELSGLQEVPDDPETTVRLIVEPGPTAEADLRRARAGLALHGQNLDAVLANRLLPSGSPDPWLAAFSGEQHAALKEIRDECARPEERHVPVYELPHAGHDPAGTEELAGLAAAAYGTVPGPVGRPPSERPDPDEPFTVDQQGEGTDRRLVLRMPLPGAHRADLELARCGDELVIGIGPYRRLLTLPSALRRCTVDGASLRGGVLAVRFRPDAGLWPVR